MALQVAESAHREVPLEVVRAIACRLVDAMQPCQVVLFGSYARGTAGPRSDLDLLVVIPDDHDEQAAWRVARDAVGRVPLPCDVLVATAGRVRQCGDLVGTVFRAALRDGRVVYDATKPQPWLVTWPAWDQEVDPVTAEMRDAETRLWLSQAADDLRGASGGLDPQYLSPGPASYLAQQAAEKSLKAILVFLQIDYPFTHDLDKIRDSIPAGWEVKELFPALKELSDWNMKGRYPSDWMPAMPKDAEVALKQARAIYAAVVYDLRDHGFVVDT